jgi:hypothetical protein
MGMGFPMQLWVGLLRFGCDGFSLSRNAFQQHAGRFIVGVLRDEFLYKDNMNFAREIRQHREFLVTKDQRHRIHTTSVNTDLDFLPNTQRIDPQS